MDVPRGTIATAAIIAIEAMAKGTPHVEAALHHMIRGRYKDRFWFGVIVGLLTPGTILVIALASDAGAGLPAAAGLAALAGMWAYEDAFVRAGQSVPLS